MPDPRMRNDDLAPLDGPAEPAGPMEAPLVPKHTIAGRSLVAVVAIMTFLASLTTGAVMIVRSAASDWQSELARQVTIQVRPIPEHDIEAEVRKAVDVARAFPGVADVRPYTKEESGRLLEPWLGTGLRLEDLPVPRLIVVNLSSSRSADLARLRELLTERVTGASLDDHRSFINRMRAMAGTATVGGFGVLALVFAATILSVAFATRGAMATNRPIVEVLHFIGAKNRYIAGHFQRHFLWLGLRGGAIGGAAAILLFALLDLASTWSGGTAIGDQISALFGGLSIGPAGFAAIAVQIILLALVTAATSRRTVNNTLELIE